LKTVNLYFSRRALDHVRDLTTRFARDFPGAQRILTLQIRDELAIVGFIPPEIRVTTDEGLYQFAEFAVFVEKIEDVVEHMRTRYIDELNGLFLIRARGPGVVPEKVSFVKL
jgi:hypothetical protein